MNIPIDLLVDMVFTSPPKSPGSIQLSVVGDEKNMLPVLMNILVLGSRKLFGNTIQPDQITVSQLNTLQDYFHSMGYIIKFNYSFTPEGIPFKINIWFEKFKKLTKCNGTLIFM
jgi:hypothetical protein